MSTLILIPGPNAVTAKADFDFADYFNSDNVAIIYQCYGRYQSWGPDRALNAIITAEVDKGFLIICKQEIEVDDLFALSEDIIPPPTGLKEIINESSQAVKVDFYNHFGGTIQTTQTIAAHSNAVIRREDHPLPIWANFQVPADPETLCLQQGGFQADGSIGISNARQLMSTFLATQTGPTVLGSGPENMLFVFIFSDNVLLS